jgi:hypothetical protein
MNPLDNNVVSATPLGKPLWSWTPGDQMGNNPGGTGEIQGNPNDAMQALFNMMRKIHGYRQTMGNYSSNGGQ